MKRLPHQLLFGGVIMVSLSVCSGCQWLTKSDPDYIRDSVISRPTIHIVINSLGMTFPEGTDENDNPYLKYIEDSNDLDIQVTLPPPEVYEEKLDVIMSSGNLPDMLHTNQPIWFDNYVKQEGFMSLDRLIDQYGPHLKEKIPEEVWDRVRYNGQIYAIPSLNEVSGIELMYIRKDWLDRLGLSPPVTLEEYYQVMKAFVYQDPDGNGQADTLGVTFTSELGRSAPFFGAFGTQLDTWLERDGSLIYGNILPETKQALSYLARLYNDNLLDREFPLNMQNNLYEKIEQGKVGLFSATWYDTRGPIAANQKRDPDAEWMALDYPTGPNGANGVYGQDQVRGYNVIPVGSKHPELVVRMLDFIAANYKDLKLGFEGDIWKMEDGQMVTDFAMHDKHLYRGIYQSLVDIPDPLLIKERLDSLGDFHLYDNLNLINDHVIANQYYGVPTPAMTKYNKQLDDLEDVMMRIIMGIEPVEAFDRYVEQWKQQGGTEITKEVNAWYQLRNKGDQR